MTGFVVALKYLKVFKSIRESILLTREEGKKILISKKMAMIQPLNQPKNLLLSIAIIDIYLR